MTAEEFVSCFEKAVCKMAFEEAGAASAQAVYVHILYMAFRKGVAPGEFFEVKSRSLSIRTHLALSTVYACYRRLKEIGVIQVRSGRTVGLGKTTRVAISA